MPLCWCRYKTRAYRFLNKEKVEKMERRELEKQRVRAEAEAKRAQEEADRKALADLDALEDQKVRQLTLRGLPRSEGHTRMRRSL